MKYWLFLWVVTLLACSDGSGPQRLDVGWPTHGLDAGETRYSELDDINADNVSQLGLAWSYELNTNRGVETTPLVVAGVMYATAPWSVVHALDAKSGKLLWQFDPKVPKQWGRWACCDVVNRGVAISGDSLFLGTLDGRLIAVERHTGKQIWVVQTTPTDKPYTITGAPRVVGNLVVIGNGGAEYGVRGFVTAYHVDSGEQAWRFYTVPGNPELALDHPDLDIALPTWSGGHWWEIGGGGTAWDAMAYDADLGLIYIGVGNGSPWSRYVRSPGGGDNLFLASIIALNAQTGRLVWHYQTTPGDNWDYTATQHLVLADMVVDGELRKVLMQAPKNGFLYMLDRANGELLSANAYVNVTWASHVDIETGRPVETIAGNYANQPKKITPGPQGGHNWQPMSFSRRTGLLYLPAHDTGMWYSNDEDFNHNPRSWNLALDSAATRQLAVDDPAEFRGHLIAWDFQTHKPRWQKRFKGHWNGGLLSTAGGVLFQGTADGHFTAYRDTDGELLWQVQSTTGIFAPPMTYRIDGEQYIAVAAGFGGGGMAGKRPGAIINEYHNEGRIIVFKLGADREMPTSRPRQMIQPMLAAQTATSDVVAHGKKTYGVYCGVCHGSGAKSGLLFPDLRYLTQEKYRIFNQIVLDGVFVSLGMPSFDDVLDVADANAIKAFILDRAIELRDNPEPF